MDGVLKRKDGDDERVMEGEGGRKIRGSGITVEDGRVIRLSLLAVGRGLL